MGVLDVTIFDQIQQEIMADPLNQDYTEKGMLLYSKLLKMLAL